MNKIVRVHAREILDSRGKPTVEAEVHLDNGVVGRASVPSGASTGTAEACELRDGDGSQGDPGRLMLPDEVRPKEDAYARYDGHGVRKAVWNVDRILGPALVGFDPGQQALIDQRMIELDATENKSRLGANAILAVSLAVARAHALADRIALYQHIGTLAASDPKLPLPMTNMISGGKHADANLDFQDVLIIPQGSPDFTTQLEWIVRVYRKLGSGLQARGYEGYLVGDEGGYGPRLKANREAVHFVNRAIRAAQLEPGSDCSIALDVAATHFFMRNGRYRLRLEQDRDLTVAQMIELLASLVDEFPIMSIEDGLRDDDWSGWRELTSRLGDRVMLVGDDLFATNEKRLQRGIDEKAANAVLIKPNQIGTLTETLRTMQLARNHGYKCIVSARSGETEDDFLADLAVGTAADYIKIGGVARSERLAKYNRLLRIAEELG